MSLLYGRKSSMWVTEMGLGPGHILKERSLIPESVTHPSNVPHLRVQQAAFCLSNLDAPFWRFSCSLWYFYGACRQDTVPRPKMEIIRLVRLQDAILIWSISACSYRRIINSDRQSGFHRHLRCVSKFHFPSGSFALIKG